MEAEVCSLAPPDWPIKSVEEVCQRVTSGGTPSRRESTYYLDGKWPWVKTQELQDKWIDDTEEHVTDQAVRESSAKVLPAKTVLLAMYGATVGQLGLLRRPMACNQACCAMIVDEKEADYRYLFYHLLNARPQLKGLATGAAQQNLSGVLIKSLRFPFPRVEEQTAIAHILGTLDDKIELNRRMNETLEAIARAIFKSWFVDFDPVRAKAEGRQPVGMDAETAALFPDAFEDSPLGEIPQGWSVCKIGEVATLSREVLDPAGYPDETFDHYSIPAFDEGRWPKAETGAEIKSHKFVVPPNSILLSKLNPRIPRVWLPYINHYRRSVCSTEFVVTLPKPTIPRAYVYDLFNSDSFLEIFATLVTGTSGSHQRVKPEYLLNMDVFIPSEPSLRRFSEIAESLSERGGLNLRQSHTLAAIRDKLLPRLLSGEFRVAEAEKLTSQVT